jgi:TPR repeat protein
LSQAPFVTLSAVLSAPALTQPPTADGAVHASAPVARMAGQPLYSQTLRHKPRGRWQAPQTRVEADAAAPVGRANPEGVAAHAAADRGDYEDAVRLWRPLAERGDPDAQYNLGVMYHLGHGVAVDHKAAFSWYRRAADKGVGVAMGNLAILYVSGAKSTTDFVQAYKWFTLAVERIPDPGMRQSMAQNRQLISANMTRAQVEAGEALARAWVAAHRRHAKATPMPASPR